LNGGTVPDDPALPSRFHSLAPGDLALFRFRGDPAPDEVDVILVTASADGAAHNALDRLVPTGRRSMISLTPAQIEAALAGMTLPEGSPLAELEPPPEVEAAIEEVALGGSPEPALVGRRGGRRLTPAELAQARDDAQRIGADGETLLHAYLQQQMFDELEWVSQLDAAAPFDFRYRHQSGDTVKMDAKSTTGSFDRRIHVSTSEMLEASKPGARYVIARVYEIDDDGGKLRLCENFAEFARSITSAVALPSGVRIDGFSIDPSSLAWSNEIELVRSVADNNDD
jgi:hypothetical protein